MCVVSAVGDEWNQRKSWPDKYINQPLIDWPDDFPSIPDGADPDQVQKLIEAFTAAREKDIEEGNEDCPDDSKLKFIDEIIENMKHKLGEAVLSEDDLEMDKIKSIIESLIHVKGYL